MAKKKNKRITNTASPPKKAAPQRSLYVDFGVLSLVISVGFAMTGYMNLWAGIILVTLTIVFFTHRLFSKTATSSFSQKRVSFVFLLGGYGLFLYVVLPSAPLVTLFALPLGNYHSGDQMRGITWTREYQPVNIMMSNETDMEYKNFDAFVRTNLLIAKVGIESGINQCVASVETPSFQYFLPEITNKNTSTTTPLGEKSFPAMSSTYRIRCDKIAANSRIEVLLAVVGPKKVEWSVLSAKYNAANRLRERFFHECYSNVCLDMPLSRKAFEKDPSSGEINFGNGMMIKALPNGKN